jgi:hypothetical protein
MLAQRLSLDEIIATLEHEFHTPRPELVADVCDFVRKLEAKNLLRHGVFAPAKRGWLANLLLARTGISHR